MDAAYDAFNAAAKAAWDALKAAYADALRDDQKGDAEDNHRGAHDEADEKDRFAGDELAAAIAEAAALRAAAIVLAASTASANKVKAATIAENERAFAHAAASASKTKAIAMASLQASRRESDFIANAAQREDAIAARGTYEVNVYSNIESTISSQIGQLGVTLTNYRQAVATADRIRANLVRAAKDAYEDAISMAGLTEVQATNAANIAKRTAIVSAETTYNQNVAAADKGQTIAYANSFYDLYLAITTAEAILRETLFVSTATTARQKVGTESDQAKAIADAELARMRLQMRCTHCKRRSMQIGSQSNGTDGDTVAGAMVGVVGMEDTAVGVTVGAAGTAGEATYSGTQPTAGEATDTGALEAGMGLAGDLVHGMEVGDLVGVMVGDTAAIMAETVVLKKTMMMK
jgi:hypothetical protein